MWISNEVKKKNWMFAHTKRKSHCKHREKEREQLKNLFSIKQTQNLIYLWNSFSFFCSVFFSSLSPEFLSSSLSIVAIGAVIKIWCSTFYHYRFDMESNESKWLFILVWFLKPKTRFDDGGVEMGGKLYIDISNTKSI